MSSPSICWFTNSESFVIARPSNFRIFNLLVDPYEPALKIELDLGNSSQIPPKLALNDRILILLNNEGKLIFYDLLRQKVVVESEIKTGDYQVFGDQLIIK